jgi:uncharacterized protein
MSTAHTSLGLSYRLKDLETESKDLQITLSREQLIDALGDLGIDAEVSAVQLTAQLSECKATVLCDGWLRGEITLPCQRCLEAAKLPVAVRVHHVYVLYSEPAPSVSDAMDDEVDEDDQDLGHHDGEWVDLWPLLREQLILMLPMTLLCEEECRGLCSQCGTNHNLSSCGCPQAVSLPRLSALSDLKLPH